MKQAVFYGPGDLRIEDHFEAPLEPGEIEVAVERAAVCGTDVKSFLRGHPILFPKLPSRFGHEFVGKVVAVAEGVDTVSVGDRIVAANSAPCYKCFYCTSARENLCSHLKFLNGAFGEMLRIPKEIVARNLYKVDSSVPAERVVSAEPLACVVNALENVELLVGEKVAVIGAGAIGCMFSQVLARRGCEVFLVDHRKDRLGDGSRFGAHHRLEVSELGKLRNQFGVAVDATGKPEGWRMVLDSLQKGGLGILFGGVAPGETLAIEGIRMHYDSLTLKGSFHHTPRAFRSSITALTMGFVEAEHLIDASVRLEGLSGAIEDMAKGRFRKVVVECSN